MVRVGHTTQNQRINTHLYVLFLLMFHRQPSGNLPIGNRCVPRGTCELERSTWNITGSISATEEQYLLLGDM